MPFDIKVAGADDLARVGRALRAAGSSGKGLRRETLATIRKIAGGPMRDATRSSWKTNMPHRGGLAQRGLRMSVRTKAQGAKVGVRIVTKSANGYDLGSIDRGRLRHPVYGNRKVWADQSVPPGVITKAQEDAAPDVRVRLVHALDAINRRIESA